MKQGETSPPEHLSESDLIEQVCSNLLCWKCPLRFSILLSVLMMEKRTDVC
jgi:hypothetical protein